MSDAQGHTILEILDLETHRKDMIVLGAILKSQRGPTNYVDFEAIRAQLEIDEGGRKGKDSLIYRSLSWLEKAGFIQVDRSKHKHAYNSDVGLIHTVLRNSIKKATKEIEKEIGNIDSEIKDLSNIDTEFLATELILRAAGKEKIEKPIFAEGWENVLQLIDDKIYDRVKKGDLIRFSLEWLSRVEVITQIRLERIGSLLEKGVIFRGLEHNKIDKEIRDAFKQYTMNFRDQGYTPGFRICERQDSTYQFVGLNNDGIVLIVSEKPMSATWMPSSTNPELVDNAIKTFDEDYDIGIDIADIGSK